MRRLARIAPLDVPYGQCKCGCGGLTSIAKYNDRRWGRVAGEPVDFLVGHGNRMVGELWEVCETGYRTPCWIWMGPRNRGGYAIRGTVRYRSSLVHRQHYEEQYGPVPAGLDLDHLCRVRDCVNPDHVEPVTRAENARRGAGTILTLADVAEIRASEESDAVLSKRFGVAPGAIWNARSGRQWTAV